ncbi:MAG TPA: YggT family protein [Gemmatimonadaceae bacterium]|nr:YggT family protein [Gemmatimonadaceae bacterium]
MSDLLTAFDAAIDVVRRAALVLAVVALVVFTVDWLVRTRRLSPFGAVARFFRRVVDPLLEPMERRVVRAGGLPSSAPWWALVTVVVGGLLVLLLLQGARGMAAEVMLASRSPRGLFRVIVEWTFGLLRLALIVRVVASWLRLTPYAWWLRWTVTLTEWLLRPLRRVLPPFGMMDVSPLVALLVLWIAEALVLGWV